MLFYKFILTKMSHSVILSIMILYSVLYIFSIIELLGESYQMLDTLVLGLINTLELLLTVPNIIFIMSLIIFWNNIKNTNELIIIRHYISLKKLILILSVFILMFSILEIKKDTLNSYIKNIKDIYLSNSIKDKISQKIFYYFDDQKLTITKLSGLNLKENIIDEVSIFRFQNNEFIDSIYSNQNQLIEKKIIMQESKIIKSSLIEDMGKEHIVNIDKYGEDLYNNKLKINITNKTKFDKPKILNNFALIIVLFIYVSLFLSKNAIPKNSSTLKYISMSFIIFIYSFVTTQIHLQNYNLIFHISVLLTLLFYLYKNLINE